MILLKEEIVKQSHFGFIVKAHYFINFRNGRTGMYTNLLKNGNNWYVSVSVEESVLTDKIR